MTSKCNTCANAENGKCMILLSEVKEEVLSCIWYYASDKFTKYENREEYT